MHELKRVLVVGAGTMGSQIALQTALSGRYEVTLVDSAAGQLERARAHNLAQLHDGDGMEKVHVAALLGASCETGEPADCDSARVARKDRVLLGVLAESIEHALLGVEVLDHRLDHQVSRGRRRVQVV